MRYNDEFLAPLKKFSSYVVSLALLNFFFGSAFTIEKIVIQ